MSVLVNINNTAHWLVINHLYYMSQVRIGQARKGFAGYNTREPAEYCCLTSERPRCLRSQPLCFPQAEEFCYLSLTTFEILSQFTWLRTLLLELQWIFFSCISSTNFPSHPFCNLASLTISNAFRMSLHLCMPHSEVSPSHPDVGLSVLLVLVVNMVSFSFGAVEEHSLP